MEYGSARGLGVGSRLPKSGIKSFGIRISPGGKGFASVAKLLARDTESCCGVFRRVDESDSLLNVSDLADVQSSDGLGMKSTQSPDGSMASAATQLCSPFSPLSHVPLLVRRSVDVEESFVGLTSPSNSNGM